MLPIVVHTSVCNHFVWISQLIRFTFFLDFLPPIQDVNGLQWVGSEAFARAQADKAALQEQKRLPLFISLLRQFSSSSSSSSPLSSSSSMSPSTSTSSLSSAAVPLSLSSSTDLSRLSFWGFPSSVLAHYSISSLYPWQVSCLMLPAILDLHQPRNLLYTAPTSAGKTLVAEILLLRSILCHPSTKILFVLPFVALVQEKANDFRKKFSSLHLIVREYCGAQGGEPFPPGVDIAVATFEKVCWRCL